MASGASSRPSLAADAPQGGPPMIPEDLPPPEPMETTTVTPAATAPMTAMLPPRPPRNEQSQQFTKKAPTSTAAMRRVRLINLERPQENDSSTTPRQSNTNDAAIFTPVLTKKTKAKPLEPKLLTYTGISLTRIGRRQDIKKQSVNFQELLSAIATMDQGAYILPHNKDTSRMLRINTMLKKQQDYTTFMDITHTNWGKPSDNKSRIAMSFYIASDVIVEGIPAFKKSRPFQEFINKFKLTLSPHNLLQTESKAVAFFSGKSPVHTWRDDLRKRFQLYLDAYLADTGWREHIFGADDTVPTEIPFYFKVIKAQSRNHNAQAIAIYVGKNHHATMEQLLSTIPFPDIEVVLLSQKRHTPELYDKRVLLHKTLCETSCAIKLISTSDEFRMSLAHQLRENEDTCSMVVDVAESSSTSTDGTLYIQCLIEHKPTVLEYIEEFLAAYATRFPHDTGASIASRRGGLVGDSSVNSPTPTVNTWSKFQSAIESAQTTPTGTHASSSVPANIAPKHIYSFSSVVSGNRNTQTSIISSPTASRNEKTNDRDKEIDRQLQTLQTQVQNLIARSPGSSATSSTLSSKSKREIELEAKVARLESMFTTQMVMLAKMQQALEQLTARQDDPGRKRSKTGPSPLKPPNQRDSSINDAGMEGEEAVPPDITTMNGGIDDDDLSDTMLQNCDAEQDRYYSSTNVTTSPMAEDRNDES